MKIKIKKSAIKEGLFGFGSNPKGAENSPERNKLGNELINLDKQISQKFKDVIYKGDEKRNTPLFDFFRKDIVSFGWSGGKQGNLDQLITYTTNRIEDIREAAANNTIDSASANIYIEGIKKIFLFLKANVLDPLSENKQNLSEILGMKQKRIDSFILGLERIPDNGVSGAAPAAEPAAPAPAEQPAPAAAPAAPTVPKQVPVFKATPESGGDVLSMRLKGLFSKVQGGEETLKKYLKMVANQLRANNIKLMEQQVSSPSRAATSDNLATQLAGFRSKTARSPGMSSDVSGPAQPGFSGTGANIQVGSIDLFGPAILLLKQAGMEQKPAAVLATQIQKITANHLKKYGVNLPEKASRIAMLRQDMIKKKTSPAPEDKKEEPKSAPSPSDSGLGDEVPEKPEKEKQAILDEPVKFVKKDLVNQMASSIKSLLSNKNKQLAGKIKDTSAVVNIALPVIKNYISKNKIDAQIVDEGKSKFRQGQDLPGFIEFKQELTDAFKGKLSNVSSSEMQSLVDILANLLKDKIIDKVKEKEGSAGSMNESKTLNKMLLLAGIIRK